MRKSNRTVTLRGQSGRYLALGKNDVLYMAPRKDDAVRLIFRGDGLIEAIDSVPLFLDLYDETNPKPIFYGRARNTRNQTWNIESLDDGSYVVYSRNPNVIDGRRGLSYEGSDVFFRRQARPFFVEGVAQVTEEPASVSTFKQPSEALTNIIDNANALRSVYEKGFAFPEWTLETFAEFLTKYGSVCRVYYSEGTLADAQTLAIEREPCNIAMNRHYDVERMQSIFGWSIGYYEQYFREHNRLAPNIAIYCPVAVRSAGNPERVAHMFNAIGYAFDSKRQPDHQLLLNRTNECMERYRNVFSKVYRCARDIQSNHVVMSLVGGGVFSNLWPGGTSRFLQEVWFPAFFPIVEEARQRGIVTSFMGPSNLAQQFPQLSHFRNVGLWPDAVYNLSKDQLRETLFVNAWDPFSIVGNGNASDNSLDGFVGRTTNAGLMSWPMTNTYLLEKARYIKV